MIDDEKIKENLSRNIKKFRINANMTQEMLAEKVNISTQFLRDIEAGRKMGSINTLVNISYILEITPNELLYDIFKEIISKENSTILEINKLSKRDKKIIEQMIIKMLEK